MIRIHSRSRHLHKPILQNLKPRNQCTPFKNNLHSQPVNTKIFQQHYFHTTKKNTTTTTRRSYNSSPPSSSSSSSIDESTSSLTYLIGTISIRILSACALISLTSEYTIELTRCEGPSMMPTIRSTGGEIIVVERFSSRWYGLEGGPSDRRDGDDHDDDDDTTERLNGETTTTTTKHQTTMMRKGGDIGSWRAKRNRRRQRLWEKQQQLSDSNPVWHEPIPIPTSSPQFNDQWPSYISMVRRNLNRVLRSGVTVGDVIVLQHPERDGTVCKRVLGLPGDTVVRPKEKEEDGSNVGRRGGRWGDIRRRRGKRRGGGGGGVDGEDVWEEEMRRWRSALFGYDDDDDPYDDSDYSGGMHHNLHSLFHDDVDDNDDHDHDNTITPSLHDCTLLTVPDGHIWVEGDNSTNSADSRHYGPVPAALIVGKVFFRVWPLRGESMSIMRGGRPMSGGIGGTGGGFTGSLVLPAGYEGERMVGVGWMEKERIKMKKKEEVEMEKQGEKQEDITKREETKEANDDKKKVNEKKGKKEREGNK